MRIQPLDNRTDVCECGKQKKNTSIACRRCSFMDGRTKTARGIIGELRIMDGMTNVQLSNALNISLDTARAACVRLASSGRIRNAVEGERAHRWVLSETGFSYDD